MKYNAGDFEYWVARRADEPVVRDILARVSTGGQIQLAFQREPDALGEDFGALSHDFILARNRRNDEYVGVCERVVRECHVNGERRRLAYLAGLRVVPGFRHRLLVLRGGFEALRRLSGDAADLGWSMTSIMSDNAVARRVLGANLRGMPRYESVGEFSSFVLTAHGAGEAERATDADLPELSALLLAHGARRQFSPVWTLHALRAAMIPGGLKSTDFFVVRRDGAIRACASLWDVSAHRQLVVAGYAPWLRRSRTAVNLAGRLLGLPKLPPPGGRLRNAYLSHLAVEDGAADDLMALVGAVRAEARRRGIELVFMGHASHHGFAALLRRQPRQREFKSQVYTVRWPDDEMPQLDPRLSLAPELAFL